MYFPYVYGRQSELLALRAAASKYLSPGIVCPVIEPVKLKEASLIRCLETLGKSGQSAIVVLNPYQGDFKRNSPSSWREAVNECVGKYPSLIPGVLLHGDMSLTAKQVSKLIASNGARDFAMIYQNCKWDASDVAAIAAAKNVKFHIVLQRKISSTHQGLLPRAKTVHIVDGFNKQPRNADYGAAEYFSDSHKTFKQQGIGFGDYTIIGERFEEGGGPPGAIAIHITYRHQAKDEIWVEHFLSDETDRFAGTVESKYLDAVGKLATSHPSRKREFGMNESLGQYFTDHVDQTFPGLPKNKERQILHHIARMHDLLSNGT